MEDIRKIKFDVVILAGQSNAEGNALEYDYVEPYHNDRVYEVNDSSLIQYGYGQYVYKRKQDFEVGFATERKHAYLLMTDFSETFADKYIENGLLDDDRKILIVKTAVGGTGFALKQWGIGNVIYNRALDMIDFALSLNPENRLVAFLWHQGEHDAFERPELNVEEREKIYYGDFKSTVDDVRKRYNVPNLPIIAGEMVNCWADENKPATDAIEKATARVCADVGNAKYVSSEGLSSNSQGVKGSVDTIHFCRKSIIELGSRYFDAYKDIIVGN